jgi:superfamily II DNA helicase RecQ
VFYSKVDRTEGKARRLKEWIEGGRVIVAINAIGAGIDIPDIRRVVYVGSL